MHSFADFGLGPALHRALDGLGYNTPTPIQTEALPPALAGRDLIACAQTGSGKTAAFALPFLQRLAARQTDGNQALRRQWPECLVLVPTRELAIQVEASFRAYGRFVGVRTVAVYGGVGYGAQTSGLRAGTDVLVATPGRLLDLIGRGDARLDRIKYFVLDEADRMLDLGFLPQVRRVVTEGQIPRDGRQTLLFSATISPEVGRLARDLLSDPVRVETAANLTVDTIEQRLYPVAAGQKSTLLAKLMRDETVESALIFTRTRRGADRLSKDLRHAGLENRAIHSGVTQRKRESTLEAFREGKIKFVVATDVASRGLDIPHISHVVNHDVPNVAEDYVHRIGRTGRAGRSGVAITLYSRTDEALWQAVEALTSKRISPSRLAGFSYLPDNSEPNLTRRQRAARGRSQRTSAPSSGGRGTSEQAKPRAGRSRPNSTKGGGPARTDRRSRR